jgi:hypothetical protein
MRLTRSTLAASAAVCLIVTGCSSTNDDPAATTPAPSTTTGTPAAEPGQAEAPTVPPVGTVVPIGNAPEGIVIGTSGIGAVSVRSPDGIELFDATTGAVRQTIPTEGSARHLSLAGPDGPVLVPLEQSDEFSQLSLADGTVTSTASMVGRQPHDAVQTSDGTIVVTNEMGGGVVFIRDGKVASELPAGPVQPGGLAAVGQYAAVADVQGNGVWVYDGVSMQQVAQASVGQKLTHALALNNGLAAFADTDGGAVLIERIGPQITNVSRVDAPGNPYGMAFDPQRNLMYITLTASNILRVVDTTNPEQPRIVGDVPTVQQPNSVAVDPRTGGVVVTGSDPDGSSSLQIVTPNLLPR